MKQIIFDLKTLTHANAGIGRYCINLTSHLLKRNKYHYFGILGPESDNSLIDIESKKNFNNKNDLIRFSMPINSKLIIEDKITKIKKDNNILLVKLNFTKILFWTR